MAQNITGFRIKKIRKDKGMTQEMVVARLQSTGLDMSRSTYSKVELQIRQVRDVELIAFANVLGVDIHELFDEELEEA